MADHIKYAYTYWVEAHCRPDSRKVAPIARTLGGQHKNGHVPLLSGSRHWLLDGASHQIRLYTRRKNRRAPSPRISLAARWRGSHQKYAYTHCAPAPRITTCKM